MTRVIQPSADGRVINARLGIDWSNWDYPSHLAYSQRDMIAFWPTAVIAAPDRPQPLTCAGTSLELGRLQVPEPGTGRTLDASELLQRRLFNDALLVMHRGQVVHESYRNGMLDTDRHVNHSTTKSLTTLLIGLAIEDGLVDPAAPITDYLAELADLPAWRQVRVQHALDMRTGLAYEEHYEDPDCICWGYFRATGYYPPRTDTHPGYIAWVRDCMSEGDCPPGERFVYSSPVTNALGMVAASVYGKSVAQLLEEKIYQRIGAEADAWLNLDPSGVAVTEGQLSLRLRDFARWACLFLNDGRSLAGEQVVPSSFIRDIVIPREELRRAWRAGDYADMFPQGQYCNQTYVLDAPCSQLAMLGIHGQFCLIDLPNEIMMVGYGSYPTQVDAIMVESLLTLWGAVRSALED
ncbi:MAG: serine hydrolase [Halieaceae bacterium]|nr:serine hydrolase [Halieaceae bacterium]MCP5194814.1 serine hydrolase [Pseudomonadales bacterium]